MSSDAAPELQADKYYQFRPFEVPKYRVEFERAKKLSDVPGYTWYTPAPLFLWGRFSETNLSDIVQRTGIQLFWYRFDKPIFQGFAVPGDTGWNHILWAIRDAEWRKLMDAVLETVQFDIDRKRLYQYAAQHLTIYDPLAVDSQVILTPALPTVEIKVFAVLSNERQYAFDTRNKTVRAQPSVVSFAPSELHVAAARRLFARTDLTQDQAFEAYKRILLSMQDVEYQKQIQQKGRP